MATKKEADAAVVAVRNGVADKRQQEIARREAQQAGSRGNAARDAFKGK